MVRRRRGERREGRMGGGRVSVQKGVGTKGAAMQSRWVLGDRDEDKGERGCAGVDNVARGGAEWNHLRIRARSGLGDLSRGFGRTPSRQIV